MAVEMRGNRIIDANQRRKFNIHSNQVRGFEIGEEGVTAYYLSGEVVGQDEEEEFLFNGKLFLPNAEPGGIIIDSFPKAEAPQGWEKRHSIDPVGWDLVHRNTGTVILGFRERGDICDVTTNVYDENGEVVAECAEDTLKIHRGPANIPPWIWLA